jgi:hypothetical protein
MTPSTVLVRAYDVVYGVPTPLARNEMNGGAGPPVLRRCHSLVAAVRGPSPRPSLAHPPILPLLALSYSREKLIA